jgi:hypothetical protein
MLVGLGISSLLDRPQRFDFRFSQGAFRDDEIFESATSTPSRYLLEIGRRLGKAVPQADRFVIGNPLLPLGSAQLDEWTLGVLEAPSIVTDRSGFPIAYVLPRALFEERQRFLLPLSCVDFRLDARLLKHLTGLDVGRMEIALDNLDAFPAISANGWLNHDRRLRVLKVQAEIALHNMDRRSDWRDMPFAAFHPDHAADTVFAALASKQASPCLFDKQVFSSAFHDMIAACSPALEPVEFRLPPTESGRSASEYRSFVNALENLGKGFADENYVIFARFVRMEHATPFHLIDHAKFALGDPMESIERTIYGQPPVSPKLCDRPVKPLKILFHLNGDGPLATYPMEQTRILFHVLKGLGCDLSVLDRPDLEAAGARSVSAGNIAALQALVETHHLFVGIDAHPLHFAKLVMGRPTVGLFGNTKPCLRDGVRSRDYRALAGHLPCSSCLSKQDCPMFGGKSCKNYVKPQTVASELLEMAFEYYGFCPG